MHIEKWWGINTNKSVLINENTMNIQGNKISLVKDLYYKEFYSAREIAQRLNVFIDAVYYFMKKYNYVRIDFNINKQNKMPYGLIHVRYADKKLFLLMKDWLNIFKKEFMKGR